ncbi:hypothetical protein Y032_0052g2197 [Ancylostoma ceylanicum]|nr:hypothetical protein Y032_0052g2197 [Ancylostoma ceylanicum]
MILLNVYEVTSTNNAIKVIQTPSWTPCNCDVIKYALQERGELRKLPIGEFSTLIVESTRKTGRFGIGHESSITFFKVKAVLSLIIFFRYDSM